MSRQQNADQQHNLLTGDKSFVGVAKFKHMGKIAFRKKLRGHKV
jgi:hypothetical protein